MVKIITRNYNTTVTTPAPAPVVETEAPGAIPTHLYICIFVLVLVQIVHSVVLTGFGSGGASKDTEVLEGAEEAVNAAVDAAAEAVSEAAAAMAAAAEVETPSGNEVFLFLSLVFLVVSLGVLALTVHDSMVSERAG